MATLQGKAVKNTYRQVLQIGANNVGVSGTLQPVQDGAGVNTALSLSTLAATVNGDLTITGDLIITGGGLQIKDLIDDTVAALIQNGTGITWTYNDGAATLTGNFTGTTSVVPEGSNLYYTQGRFDSAFAAKSTTNLAEGTNLYFTNARARTALSVTGGTGIAYDNATGVFNLAAIPNASLANSSITINGQAVSLGGTVTLTTTNIAEGTNLYYTQARFDTAFSNKSTTNLAEGSNLYYTQARFNTAFAAKTTTDLAEGTNLYYTDARARLALSSSATGLSYANNSGIFSLTAGYAIPTTVKLGQYDIAYNRSIVSAAVTGTSTKTLSLTQQDANVITATWTDQGITTINGTANQIAATTVGNTTTIGFTNDVTMPNNLVVSGNLTINGTATYVNTESISSKDPLFEVANTNNTTDAVDIGYYGRYYDSVQERVEFTGLFRDASDAGKFKIFTGLVDEPTNVVNTTGTGYTVATLVANVDGNLNGTANAANILSTARTIAASGDATWSVSFNGSANVSSSLTLANTGVTATTYGTSTAVPTIAVDSKGRITSASNTNITFPVTTVNGFAGTVVLTTSDVAEGTNQYFTTARAQAAITGGASSVVTANLTASRALVSDGSGKIAASATTTTTEVGYLAGVTSAIQTQLDSKLNLTGGTLTGGLIGTTGSFSSSGSGDTFTIGHTSGSGIALNITKNGNGEGLYINKASGSGNAATIVGNLGGTTASFSGILTTPQVKAATSAGLSINANSGTQVADFGAGGSANITFFGGLAGTSATFSNNVGIGIITPSSPLHILSSSVGLLARFDSNQAESQIRIINSGTSGRSYSIGSGSSTSAAINGFYIYDENATTTRLAINSSGNIGIGTITYGEKLSVYGSSGADCFGFFSGGPGTTLGGIKIGNNGSTYGSLYWDNALNDVLLFHQFTSGSLRFGTNSIERMRILNSGNISIGSTIDSGFKTYIKAGASGLLLSAGSTSGDNTLLIQNAAENTTLFNIKGNGAATFSSTSGIGATIIADWNRSATNDSQLYIKGATNGNKQLRIGYDTTGNVGYIQALTSGTSVDNLLLNPSGGNVGIGTSSPSALLHISGSGDQYVKITSTSNSNAGVRFNSVGGNEFSIFSDTSLRFYDFTAGAERMRITSSGALLINTTTLVGSDSRLNVYSGDGGPTFMNGNSGQQTFLLWNQATTGNNLWVEFHAGSSLGTKGSIDYLRSANLTRYNTTSDAHLKNIIGDSNLEKSVEILNTTKIREYSWKEDESNKPHIGVIAQELYETYKGAVSVGSDESLLGTEDYKSWKVDKTAFTKARAKD
jgi:hypothetical protein